MTFSYKLCSTVVAEETRVALMEMMKMTDGVRKKVLGTIKPCSSALHLGKLDKISLRPSEEVFNICNANTVLVKILNLLDRKKHYVQKEEHMYQR